MAKPVLIFADARDPAALARTAQLAAAGQRVLLRDPYHHRPGEVEVCALALFFRRSDIAQAAAAEYRAAGVPVAWGGEAQDAPPVPDHESESRREAPAVVPRRGRPPRREGRAPRGAAVARPSRSTLQPETTMQQDPKRPEDQPKPPQPEPQPDDGDENDQGDAPAR